MLKCMDGLYNNVKQYNYNIKLNILNYALSQLLPELQDNVCPAFKVWNTVYQYFDILKGTVENVYKKCGEVEVRRGLFSVESSVETVYEKC